MKLKRIYGM